jgi:hypothetical protein
MDTITLVLAAVAHTSPSSLAAALSVVPAVGIAPIVAAGILLGLKGLSSWFGKKSADKQYGENRDATVAGLNIKQEMSEDKRRAMLALANSLLGGVPGTTGGGNIRTNVALDPALFAQLNEERKYDFGSAVPEKAGGMDGFLSGLFGGAAETVPYMSSAPTTPSASTPEANPFGIGQSGIGMTVPSLADMQHDSMDEDS